ncbi:MAG: MFS transporter [Thermomicrobiales bacterium]|nr:MFS transporter [Thermomicrobiales bacterium]
MASSTSAQQIEGFDQLRGKQVIIAMAGVLLGLLLSSLDGTIVGTAMPRIISDLGGLDHYAWVATSYLLTSTAAVPIFGKLSDIYGRKWFYIGGLIFFMAASALCGLSQSMTQLILFRGLQGIAGGILTANAFAIIGDLFPPAERGKWQGVSGSVFGISSVVGPALGGWLTDGPGWRWVFYVNLPVGVLAVLVLLYGLPHIRPHEPRPIDWLGAATIVGGTVPLLLAFSWGGTEYPWASPQIIGLLAIAVAMTGLFLFAERRAPEPIIDLRLFHNRTFVVSVIAMFLVGAGMFGAIMYIPLFMQGVLAVSATASGAILTPMMLSLVAASTIGGQIISRTGRYKWASVGGLALMGVGMWLQTLMGVNTTNAEAVRNMIVLGLGTGLAMPTFTLAVQNSVSPREIGAVTAAVQFFRSIGSTIGVAVMGSLMTTILNQELARDLPAEVTAALPANALASISPQALASPEAAAALQTQFAGVPNGEELFAALMDAMRQALATAIHDVFLMAAVVSLGGVIAAAFLPEAPLRKRRAAPELERAGKELAAEGAGTAQLIPARDEPQLFAGDGETDDDDVASLDGAREPVGSRRGS